MKRAKTFVGDGSKLYLITPSDSTIKDLTQFGTGVFTVKYDEKNRIFYLDVSDGLTLPEKVYGVDSKFIKRVIKSFQASDKPLGVLLSGKKGTGKTVTAKRIALDTKLPVIKLNISWTEERLDSALSFLSEIPVPFVLFIDEFEKLYPEDEEQQKFLPFLDGGNSNHVLTIMTVNETKISEYMTNRLQRIRYHKKYDNFDIDVACEIFDDKIKPRYAELKEKFLQVILFNRICTMDIIIGLVEEINIHGQEALEDTSVLNLEMEMFSKYAEFPFVILNDTTGELLELPGKVPEFDLDRVKGDSLNTLISPKGISAMIGDPAINPVIKRNIKGAIVSASLKCSGMAPNLKTNTIELEAVLTQFILYPSSDFTGDSGIYPEFTLFKQSEEGATKGIIKRIKRQDYEAKIEKQMIDAAPEIARLGIMLKNTVMRVSISLEQELLIQSKAF